MKIYIILSSICIVGWIVSELTNKLTRWASQRGYVATTTTLSLLSAIAIGCVVGSFLCMIFVAVVTATIPGIGE